MKNLISLLAVLVFSLAPLASSAEEGSLWEMTSQMEMPDMPEGHEMPAGMMGAMGGRTMKICRGEDERDAVSKNKDMKDCEINDFKQTATKVSMTVKCKEDRSGKMEFTYNKARTEYKGTMRMKDGKHGEMTMRLTGKKLGPCDAKKAKAEQTAMIEKHKAMADDAQAQYSAMTKKAEKDQIKGCAKALDKMNPNDFSFYGYCRNNKKDASCKSLMADYAKSQPKVAAECSKMVEEFCENYETPEGFQKVGRDESRQEAAGRMCGKDPDDLRKKLCKGAGKTEAFEFLGANCPEQAKPLAKKHCAGRSYTVKEGDPRRVEKKWFKFCVAVAGTNLEDSDSDRAEAPAPKDVEDAAKKEAKKEAKKAAKGAAVDALKGLFGR